MKRRAVVHCLFLVYILILLRITVFRSSFSMEQLWQNGEINLSLLQGYLPLIMEGRWFRLLYLFVGNIVWFVPMGVYLLWTGRVKKIGKAVLAGLIFSLIIECMQYIFGTGISELDDLVLNTLGTWAGALGYQLMKIHIRK